MQNEVFSAEVKQRDKQTANQATHQSSGQVVRVKPLAAPQPRQGTAYDDNRHGEHTQGR
jgi:hypothetical protein